jgi:hypothetical protein
VSDVAQTDSEIIRRWVLGLSVSMNQLVEALRRVADTYEIAHPDTRCTVVSVAEDQEEFELHLAQKLMAKHKLIEPAAVRVTLILDGHGRPLRIALLTMACVVRYADQVGLRTAAPGDTYGVDLQ